MLAGWRRGPAKADQARNTSNRARHAEALTAAIEAFSAGTDIRATLRAIARAGRAALAADRTAVWVVDVGAGLARSVGQAGEPPPQSLADMPDALRLNEPAVAALFATGSLQIAHDLSTDAGQALARRFQARSFVGMPFLRGGVVAGIVFATSDRAHRDWAADDVTTLSALALQAGLALERASLTAETQRLGVEDALTGLPNLNLFLDRLGQALAAAELEATPLAVGVLNLDGFKDINDALGHAAGDDVLREVAARLRRVLRAHETVARLGGDEFAVLLPAQQHTAELVAERLLRALSGPLRIDGHELAVATSMGIATYPDHGQTAETLLRRADTALAQAKRTQTGFAVAAVEDTSSTERFTLISGLRQLLAGGSEAGQLELHFQAKVDCQTGLPVGAEALVRWYHPTLGLVAPIRFISLAEQTGLIKLLTRWALNAAVRQCQSWLAEGWRVGVAVNLSARDVQDADLPEYIASVLARYAVPAELLTVEITEGMLVEDPAQALTVLSQLDALGVRGSLDDFGTGYSSLAYLKRLPVRELKIDQSFIRELVKDQRDQAIVASTIGLGHSLGMRIVAEGVEDEATLDCLRGLGVDQVQGYFLARPQSAAAFGEWLRARHNTAAAQEAQCPMGPGTRDR